MFAQTSRESRVEKGKSIHFEVITAAPPTYIGGEACSECHMPKVTKSALGNPDIFTGDIRTHLMKIDPDQIEQFNEEGNESLSELGLNFVCRHCHVEGGVASPKSDEELISVATGIHTPAE